MQLKEQLYSNAFCGNDPKFLETIHQEEVSIAIYQRDIESLKKEVSIAVQKDLAYKASGEVDEIFTQLKDFFEKVLPQCDALLNDIIWVLNQFNAVAQADSYRLLFSTVNSNMCKKFHTDINTLRLLCTYAGPGTLWVSEDGKGTKTEYRRGQEVVIKEEQIQQAGTGHVLILKGALYPEGNPAIHRSPSIEESGDKRLLLRLDTNSFLNF